MRVKRFVGDNVADTMRKVKRELGADAVILQTRQMKEGGFFGLFAKSRVEITAAVEEKHVSTRITDENRSPVNSELIKRAYEAYREKEKEFAQDKVKDFSAKNLIESTQSELKKMHSILKEIKGHITRIEEGKTVFPEPLQKWLDFLVDRGISEELSRKLLIGLQKNLSEDQWANDKTVYDSLRRQVVNICTNTETIIPKRFKSLVVALIGPTGVGKTTTIGKLAAGFSIIERKKVALVTADTYRVAAVEQLKTFGEIIGVPVEVVMTPAGLKEAVERHSDKELIFIDTAGRSPHHDLHMSELEAFLATAEPDLTMLVMSVTTNIADQLLVWERFKKLSTHLIFTKLDESIRTGSLLDLIVKTNLPIAYLTNGQNVPDDIDAATPEKLARCVLGEGYPNV